MPYNYGCRIRQAVKEITMDVVMWIYRAVIFAVMLFFCILEWKRGEKLYAIAGLVIALLLVLFPLGVYEDICRALH